VASPAKDERHGYTRVSLKAAQPSPQGIGDPDVNRTDSIFLKHFSQLIVGLMAVTLVLILVARYAHQRFYGSEDLSSGDVANTAIETERRARLLEEADARTAPIGAFLAGEAGVARKKALEEAAAKAAAGACAYDCTKDGAVVYARLCGSCHENGAGGAPKLVHAEWDARVGQGMETLVKHAIEGYDGPAPTNMPAKGNNPNLTDEQIQITVQYMVDNLK
jgi:cytochrome c5